MKIKADKITIQKADIDIIGVTLLSAEEAEALPSEIRNIGKSWWLRSLNDYGIAAIITGDGRVVNYGRHMLYPDGVRPALEVGYERMCMVNPRLDRGDKINLAGHTWTVISDQYILCDDTVGECVFQNDWEAPYAHDYEKSDAKEFLDDWFNKNVKETA